ncbi:hypothetical protein OVA19_00270 [Streptomyces sp. SL203]|nr:hypothetical protein [Streptomyces sp. SL203]MCY1649257.1 hypothetical protein [Streptomyces sp. SL203]
MLLGVRNEEIGRRLALGERRVTGRRVQGAPSSASSWATSSAISS